MQYFHNQIARLRENYRKRQARKDHIKHLHNMLLLSEAQLADLDMSRAEISSYVLQLQLGSAPVTRR